MQIIDPAEEETHYWGDVAAWLRAIDIWIGEEAFICRGFGAQVMGLALQMCFRECGLDRSFGGQYRRTPNSTSVRNFNELSGGASAMTIVLSIGWAAKTGLPGNERHCGLLTRPARNPFLTRAAGRRRRSGGFAARGLKR